MKFSVVIPAYNVEAYLDECLGSVAAQSFGDWEAIVVDDGSTDGSAALAETWAIKDNRFRILKQTNQGLSSARNAGMHLAQGEYLLFLDGDDWLEPHALQALSSELQDEDVLCFGGRRFFQDEKRYEEADAPESKTYARGWDYYQNNALKPRRFAFVSVVLRIYRRAFLQDHQLRFKEGIFHEDNLFTPIVLFYAGKTRTLCTTLYNYRVRSGSTMTTPLQKKLFDKITVANELAAFFADKDVPKTVVYRYITHVYQTVFYEPQPKEIERQLLRAVDWIGYHRVSRTKLRHRVLYAALRISPSLFRIINNRLSR